MDLGTSACPPYHLALVIGGTSAEATLKTVKEASAGYLDNLPVTGNKGRRRKSFQGSGMGKKDRKDLSGIWSRSPVLVGNILFMMSG